LGVGDAMALGEVDGRASAARAGGGSLVQLSICYLAVTSAARRSLRVKAEAHPVGWRAAMHPKCSGRRRTIIWRIIGNLQVCNCDTMQHSMIVMMHAGVYSRLRCFGTDVAAAAAAVAALYSAAVPQLMKC